MLKTLMICGTALLIAGVHFNTMSVLIGLGIFMMTISTAGALAQELVPTKFTK